MYGEDNKEDDIFIDEEVLKLLRESMKEKIKEKRYIPNKVQLNNALKDTIAEFLECFILMGYDLNGNTTEMFIYNNKMEKSALDNLFIQKFGEFMGGKISRHDDIL